MFDRMLRRRVRVATGSRRDAARRPIAPKAVLGAVALALGLALIVEPRIALNRLYDLPPSDALDAHLIFPLEAGVDSYERWRDDLIARLAGDGQSELGGS